MTGWFSRLSSRRHATPSESSTGDSSDTQSTISTVSSVNSTVAKPEEEVKNKKPDPINPSYNLSSEMSAPPPYSSTPDQSRGFFQGSAGFHINATVHTGSSSAQTQAQSFPQSASQSFPTPQTAGTQTPPQPSQTSATQAPQPSHTPCSPPPQPAINDATNYNYYSHCHEPQFTHHHSPNPSPQPQFLPSVPYFPFPFPPGMMMPPPMFPAGFPPANANTNVNMNVNVNSHNNNNNNNNGAQPAPAAQAFVHTTSTTPAQPAQTAQSTNSNININMNGLNGSQSLFDSVFGSAMHSRPSWDSDSGSGYDSDEFDFSRHHRRSRRRHHRRGSHVNASNMGSVNITVTRDESLNHPGGGQNVFVNASNTNINANTGGARRNGNWNGTTLNVNSNGSFDWSGLRNGNGRGGRASPGIVVQQIGGTQTMTNIDNSVNISGSGHVVTFI